MTWETPLVPHGTPWERAVEGTSAARYPLPWHLVRTLHNPDRIPEDKLAILAYALSVDLWDPAWPVEKRRSVVRQALADHGLKGTIAGVRRYLEIADARLVQYLAPPQRAFASRTLTKEEFDDWLETMPQLRIYLRADPGDGTGLSFIDRAFLEEQVLPGAFTAPRYWAPRYFAPRYFGGPT